MPFAESGNACVHALNDICFGGCTPPLGALSAHLIKTLDELPPPLLINFLLCAQVLVGSLSLCKSKSSRRRRG
jgi:hypothetical protein